jgi:hypothetical protein
MDNFIARANIDFLLEMLKNHDGLAHNRTTITRLLIEEENKLSRDQEQLAFAESRAAVCRDRADRQRRLLDTFDPGSTDWVRAERLLVNFESLAQFVEGFRQQMRRQVNGSRL